MRYIAFATDYDGTIAHHGRVEPATVAALERVRASGRRLVLVTGRQVDDLLAVFPEVALFDRSSPRTGQSSTNRQDASSTRSVSRRPLNL